MTTQGKLRIVPVELSEANAFVALHHRHHFPTVGHRFSIGVTDTDGTLRGVAVVGRPVARLVNQRTVLEVTRLCTDGTPNACSALYAGAARIGKAMGYERIQTYILDSETGISLRASGWDCEGVAGGGSWAISRPDRRIDQPISVKQRWSKPLNPPLPERSTVQLPSETMQGILI